jgi:hypothetical protein
MGSKRTASGAFTDDGKKRSNAVGTCGSAQQAKAQLGIDGNVTTKDGKKGGEKWRILRTYIKDESGSKLYEAENKKNETIRPTNAPDNTFANTKKCYDFNHNKKTKVLSGDSE